MKLAGLIVGLLIAASLAWGAGELHYRNCINAAKAEHEALEGIVRAVSGNDLRQRIRDCSRLPW